MKTKAKIIIDAMLDADCPSAYWRNSWNSFYALDRARQCIQRNGQTVFDHTMNVLDALECKNEITLFAAIFHDLGKPRTRVEKDGTLLGFPGHERASVEIADKMLEEWEADPDVRDKVLRIIKTHMFDVRQSLSEKSVRKFIAVVGRYNIDNWFSVRKADAASYQNDDDYISHMLQPFCDSINKQIASLKDDDASLPSDSGMIIEGEE